MFLEVSSKWEDLQNLAHETPEYRARKTDSDYTDDQLVIGHWREIAENEARDYDTKKNTRDKYEKQGNQNEVAKLDQLLAEHDNKIKELDKIRERIKKDIKRRISGTSAPVLSSPVEIIKPCPCDTSKLERLINEKIDNIKFPIFNYQPIYDALNRLTFPTIENIREIIKEELANNNPQLIKLLPVVKPEAVKEEVKEPVKPSPKVETAEEFQQIILNKQEQQELTALKIEVNKLKLTTAEEGLLIRADTKEKVQLLEKAIKERINKEAEQKEKDRKEREIQEKKEAWNKLTPEQRSERTAEKVFNISEMNKPKELGNSKAYINSYNSASGFLNDLRDNKLTLYSLLLYKCKNQRWGVLCVVNRDKVFNWLTSSNTSDYNTELQEITELLRPYNLKLWTSFGTFYNMNAQNSIKYSLMWSLALMRFFGASHEHNQIRNESNWLPRIEKELADAEL